MRKSILPLLLFVFYDTLCFVARFILSLRSNTLFSVNPIMTGGNTAYRSFFLHVFTFKKKGDIFIETADSSIT